MFAGLRRMARWEWRKRFPGPTSSSRVRTKRSLGYFWDHVYLKAKSGPNCGSVINPDSGSSILDSERQSELRCYSCRCLKGYSLWFETRGGPNMTQTSQPEIGPKSAIKQHQNRCRIGR